VPNRISDLSVVERGDKIVISFTIPELTTEGLPLKRVGPSELQLGAKVIEIPAEKPGAVTTSIPVQEWIGQQPVVRVRANNGRGRFSAWSNEVTLKVVPPLKPPEDLKPEAVPKGVRVAWVDPNQRQGTTYRIVRADQQQPFTSDKPEYVDVNTEYGKPYEYKVQAVWEGAESEFTATKAVTPEDRFAPDVPTGVTAIAGLETVELAWDPGTAPDLKGYRVYRASDTGQFQALTDVIDSPSFSDKKIEPGKTYRYAVTSIDQKNNESEKSAAVEVKSQ
jgi:fibronectin type 3 domain-containing protein